MLDSALADELAANEFVAGYVRPDYGGYCFADVPATAAAAVGADLGSGLRGDVFGGVDQRAEHVVVLFVDALGFQQFERVYEDVPLLSSFAEAGTVTPLTSTYPSETAACVTTMHTASDPIEHGLLGWNAYDPEADAVYESLPYAALDGGDISLAPSELFDRDPIYGDLAAAGVDPHVVEPDHGPGYSDGALHGATTHFYESESGFAPTLTDVIQNAAAPSYTYAYTPVVDTAAHEHGPDGDVHDAAVANVCESLRRAFASVDNETAADTLVCLVADHGQVDVSDATTALDETGVTEHLETDRSGNPLVLGGPRNVHLRTTDRDTARDCLSDLDALVLTREEALDAGLWGRGNPGPVFDRNCGDLLVVPREGMLVPSRADPEFSMAGMHGGMASKEMLVPFGAASLADLA